MHKHLEALVTVTRLVAQPQKPLLTRWHSLQMFPLNPSAIVPSGPLLEDLGLDISASDAARLQNGAVFHSSRPLASAAV